MKRFTIAQIAAALGCSKEAIRLRLDGVQPDGVEIVGGNTANAYAFATMPVDLQNQLDAAATQRGYRDGFHLLCGHDERRNHSSGTAEGIWQPSDSFEKVSQKARDQAFQRKDVFLPFIQCKDTDTRSTEELEADGIAAYQRVFGYPISGAGFRRLLKLIIERDRNHGDWHRLEIYLTKSAAAGDTATRHPAQKFDHAEVAEAIDLLENKAAPTTEDREFLFDAAFRNLETLTAENPGQTKAIKGSLIDFLKPAGLAVSKSALERAFNRKLIAWREGGKCLKNGCLKTLSGPLR